MAATNEKKGGVAKGKKKSSLLDANLREKGRILYSHTLSETREQDYPYMTECYLLLLRSAAEGRRPILPRW